MRSVLSAPHMHNEKAAFAYVEARLWPSGPVCPFCKATGDKIGELKGKTTRLGLRKCYACRKPFTVRMGSIFESSHVPLNIWLQAIHLVCSSKKGISTRQLQRTLGGSLKTAWFLGHRIREAMADRRGICGSPMGGEGMILEADEAFLQRDPGKKLSGPGPSMPVFALVERGGNVRSFHVPDVTAARLHPILAAYANPASNLMSDESRIYKGIGWNFASHQAVKHSAREYVRGDVHTNTVEGYFSILKRGVYGTFHHVSAAHLHRYLAEFDFRYNARAKLGFDDEQRASLAVIAAKGKRLTYQTTRGARAA